MARTGRYDPPSVGAGLGELARVVGETAPLLMTSLKNDKTVLNPIMEPITALPVYIFSNVAQPYPSAVARAWGAALVLMVLVAILFTVTPPADVNSPPR